MSDDGGSGIEEDKTELNDDELAKEIEEKCWDAFLAFDKEGTG